MHCRVFQGRARAGAAERALEVVREQVERVRHASGLVFIQVLAGEEDELIAISSWKSAKDLRAYADGDMAHDFVARLTPLLVSPPTARSYEIKANVEGNESFFEHDEGGGG